jgi:tyrosine-protein phosphatase YwqE
MGRRPMNTGIVMEVIEQDYGRDFAMYLKDNAQKVINNEIVNVYQPGSLKKLFGKYR